MDFQSQMSKRRLQLSAVEINLLMSYYICYIVHESDFFLEFLDNTLN